MAQWTSVNISEPFFFGFFFMFESVPFQGESLSMFLAFALLGHDTAGSFHDHGSTDHGHLGAESWNGVCTYVHRYTHVCIITCYIYNIYIYMYAYRCIYSMYIYVYIYIIYIYISYIYALFIYIYIHTCKKWWSVHMAALNLACCATGRIWFTRITMDELPNS